LSRVYGFTPEEIGRLTKYQLHEYFKNASDMVAIGNPFAGKKENKPPPPGKMIDPVIATGVESYGLW